MNKKTIVLIIFTITLFNYSFAQKTEIEKSISAFEQCMIKKDFKLLKPHLSKSYQVGGFSGGFAHQIVPQILGGFPILTSLKTVSKDKNSAILDLNFEKIGSKKTNLTFDKDGKITYIQLFSDLIDNAETKRN
jgi:hypothetical protein